MLSSGSCGAELVAEDPRTRVVLRSANVNEHPALLKRVHSPIKNTREHVSLKAHRAIRDVLEDRRAEEQRAQDDARVRLRVAGGVEIGSPRQQRDGDEARGNRSVTETVLEVKRNEPEQDD